MQPFTAKLPWSFHCWKQLELKRLLPTVGNNEGSPIHRPLQLDPKRYNSIRPLQLDTLAHNTATPDLRLYSTYSTCRHTGSSMALHGRAWQTSWRHGYIQASLNSASILSEQCLLDPSINEEELRRFHDAAAECNRTSVVIARRPVVRINI